MNFEWVINLWYGIGSWLSSANPNFIMGALFGLLLAPIAAATHRAIDRQTARKILYDDIAISYITIALVVEEIKIIWSENAKLKYPIFEDLFSSIFHSEPEKEQYEKETARKGVEHAIKKAQILLKAKESLKNVSLKRYKALESNKILVLFELYEYQVIESIFEALANLKGGHINEEEIYNNIGCFRAYFKKLNQKYLRRGIKRMANADQLNIILKAFDADAKVIL